MYSSNVQTLIVPMVNATIRTVLCRVAKAHNGSIAQSEQNCKSHGTYFMSVALAPVACAVSEPLRTGRCM